MPCRAHAVLVLVGVAACIPFSNPALRVCGNHIVEGEEDCDEDDDAGLCGAPDSVAACRWLCSEDEEQPCAVGSFCGNDGICRRPAGDFQYPVIADASGARWFAAGDFDGDERQDLLVQLSLPGYAAVEAMYFEPPEGLARVSFGLGQPTNAAIGDFNGDLIDDIVLVAEPPPTVAVGHEVDFGHALWLGNEERMPAAGSLPTLATTGDYGRLVPGTSIDSALELVDDRVRLWLAPQNQGELPVALPRSVTELGSAIASAEIEDGSCVAPSLPRMTALGYSDAGEVLLYRSCGDEPFAAMPSVQLPAGELLDDAGTFFADVDADGVLDVLAQGDAVQVAYGVGDGTFHSTPDAPPTGGDGLFAELAIADGTIPGPLLGAADLDGDGAIEIVTTERVHWGAQACAGCTTETGISSAAIADIDRDGDLDLVGAPSSDAEVLVLLRHDPSLVEQLSRQELDLFGLARDLVVGDFDRDTGDDVAFIESLGDEDGDYETITILYGRADESWALERHGPFVGIDAITVVGRHAIVARVEDASGRAAGLFLEPGAPLQYVGALARRPVVGAFATASELELAALIVSTPQPDVLGWLPVEPGSAPPFDTTLGAAIGGGERHGYHHLEAAIDVDGDGLDELLVLGNDEDGDGHMWLASLGSDAPGTQWRVMADAKLAARFARRPSEANSGFDPVGPGSELRIADLDGDGDKDAIATTDAPEPRLVALDNDGTLIGDLAPLERIDGPELQLAQLQFWHAAEDSRSLLLVGGADGVGIATVDLAAGHYSIEQISKTPCNALGTADVDGDGLRDLLLGTDDEVQVRLAEELRGGP